MDLGLKDKIAFVAAASRGLGAATARQLAREGAKVAVNSRDAARLNATFVILPRTPFISLTQTLCPIKPLLKLRLISPASTCPLA